MRGDAQKGLREIGAMLAAEPAFLGTIAVEDYEKALADPRVQETLRRAKALMPEPDGSER